MLSNHTMTLAKILLTLASLAYPLLWYYGRENGAFFWLAAAMCALWLIRAAMPQTAGQRAVALLLAAFFAAVLVFRLPDSMYWYPVAVNALMPDLPPEGVRHTRRVTQIWCGFFVFNGITAAVLALWQHYDWWAVYTGIVSYILMGLLFAGEWIYRKLVLKV